LWKKDEKSKVEEERKDCFVQENKIKVEKIVKKRKRHHEDASCGAEYSILLQSPTTSFVFSFLPIKKGSFFSCFLGIIILE